MPSTSGQHKETHLLRYSDANLIEDLFEDLVAFLFLVLQIIIHDIIDRVTHHFLLHVHRRALTLKVVHDPLDLREVEAPVHALHRLSNTDRQHRGGEVRVETETKYASGSAHGLGHLLIAAQRLNAQSDRL